ncbi:hypothetical protein [Bdellovibrio sp. BCCA]|uniref:hypothetical protein n=1 Tax=Bdellovibrio sp. BCCA TaxID=3136281 RepID=UPI0030F0E640
MELVFATMIQVAISLVLFSLYYFRHGSDAKNLKVMACCALVFTLSTPMLHKMIVGQIAGEISSYVASGALMLMISMSFMKKKAAQENIMNRFRKAHIELDALRRAN